MKKIKQKKEKKEIKHSLSNFGLFNNREMGWLNFNLRVLLEAQRLKNPLAERIKFLAISSSNLDEFFMKRVGGLKRQIAYGLTPKSSDGLTPKKQIQLIRTSVQPMLIMQNKLFKNFKKELKQKNCEIANFNQLPASEKKYLHQYFKEKIFPILTPLSVDPGHPFPFISNLSTSLGVSLRDDSSGELTEKIFARVKIPKLIEQWIFLEKINKFIHVIEVIRAHVHLLFPHLKVLGTLLFKVTRNADSDREEEDAEDLLAQIEEELRQRRFAEIVRLEYTQCTDSWLLEYLKKELELNQNDLFEMPADFDLIDFNELIGHSQFAQDKFPAWNAQPPQELLESQCIFQTLSETDLLLHHPFESFSASVLRFVEEAAQDPQVLAIKMTLYRTGDHSPFIEALKTAAENNKQVVCLIELKARFDEHRNIIWAQELESAGVHVVYGVVGLKTHAKTILVVRKEGSSLKSYAHIGTGNYNVVTSRFYTDVGLLTSDPRITNELMELFNYLTGKSLKKDYEHLLVAPLNMFQHFKFLIQREIENAKLGLPSHIMAKFNNMEENDISIALYQASSWGVPVHLMVRGFCCLKPNLKKISDHIVVKSILGRFLEHSRIFYFRNGQKDPIDGDFYIGSADWMYRNLHARVEAITPIYSRSTKEKLWNILNDYWNDKNQSWIQKSEGSYQSQWSEKTDKAVIENLIKNPFHESYGVQNKLIQQNKTEHEET